VLVANSHSLPQAGSEPTGQWPTRWHLVAAAAALVVAAGWAVIQLHARYRGASETEQVVAQVSPAEAEQSAAALEAQPDRVAVAQAPRAASEQPQPLPADSAAPATTESELSAPPAASLRAGEAGPFDRDAAMRVLYRASTRAARCGNPKTPQTARLSVTFANDGKAKKVYLLERDFWGTSAGWCMVRVFRAVQVPPFSGPEVTLHKDVQVPAWTGSGPSTADAIDNPYDP
jgi:hypothetical protein